MQNETLTILAISLGIIVLFAILVRGLWLLITAPFRKSKKKSRGSNKALCNSLADFADKVESGEVTIDATIKAVMRDIGDRIADIEDSLDQESDAQEELTDLQYDIERILYPNGKTEKQALAEAKRRSSSVRRSVGATLSRTPNHAPSPLRNP